MKKVRVLYFAGVKDVTNKESEEISISEHWTLTDLTQSLIKEYGIKMNALLDISMYAVDMEYIDKDQESMTILKHDSEIAIIPPVSDSYYLFASSIAALVARSITYPLDTIKTRLQTKSEYTLINDDNPHKQHDHLYRGIGITLLFSVPALSLYLTCYEYVKATLDTWDIAWLAHDALLNHAISGCFAELSAGLFFTPMEVIKSQLQIIRHTTTLALAKRIANNEGLKGFYKGYWITIAVFLPHTVTYFVIYEQLKSFWNIKDQTFMVYLFCSAVASTLGIIVSTPLDIIKTRWQVSAEEHAYKDGPVKIAQHMWLHEGGFKAFTQGMLVRIAWGIPVTTINMTVFEMLLKLHSDN